MAGFNVPAYNPTPIESPQNALMRGLEMQRAQQGNALQSMQIQALIQRQKQEEEAQALTRRFAIPENRPGDGIGPTQEAGFNIDGYTNALMGVDPMKAIQLRQAMAKQERAPIIAGPGSTVLDPVTRKPIYTAPFKPAEDKTPEALRTLEAIYGKGTPEFMQAAKLLAQKMTTHTPAASIVNYGSPVPVQLPDGTTGYVQPSNKGGPVAPMSDAGGKPMVKPTDQRDKDLTEAAAKATTYLGQMRSSTKVLKDIGADQSALSLQAETALAGGPMNIAIRDKAQRVRQAQDQWSEAFLRFKTGAASTPAEVAANRKTFFPVLGDKPETIRQKAEMRLQAERDLEIPAGRGAKQLSEPASQSPGAPAAGGWEIERVN